MTLTSTQPSPPAPETPHGVAESRSLFDGPIIRQALVDSLTKLNPAVQIRNPVMFVVLVGSVVPLFEGVAPPSVFSWSIPVWLFLTVIFANFAEGMAEGRGKAQADTLRRMRAETEARRLNPDGTETLVAAAELTMGELVVCEAGDLIPSDGEIIEGIASVDEAAITGESAPVIREAGGDRSGVTGGTRVLSDRIVVRITAATGESFLDRMIALVEGAVRQKTPNEIALTLALSALTLAFVIVVIPLWPMAWNAEQYMASYVGISEPLKSLGTDVPTLVALLVCLIPTTIGALLAAIGIAGMDRALQANILTKSGKAVETAGDVDTVLLDKTGTITMGNRHATAFLPVGNYTANDVGRLAALSSIADETPEGKTIVALYKEQSGADLVSPRDLRFVPFTAQTRMSGIDLPDGKQIRKGAADAVVRY